jgi:hypothetical protein
MPRGIFEPTTTVLEREKTVPDLDLSATVIGDIFYSCYIIETASVV